MFNQGQIPVLLEELRTLRHVTLDTELAAVLTELCAFVEQAVGQIHTYVRFIGD